MKGNLSIKVHRGNTGRSGFHLIADSPTSHVEVQAFVLEVCGSQATPNWTELLLSNPIAAAIAREVEVTLQPLSPNVQGVKACVRIGFSNSRSICPAVA